MAAVVTYHWKGCAQLGPILPDDWEVRPRFNRAVPIAWETADSSISHRWMRKARLSRLVMPLVFVSTFDRSALETFEASG